MTVRATTWTCRLAPVPAAARDARSFLTEALAECSDWCVETARLLVSEIVTNAVLHACTPMVLRVTLGLDQVRVELSDGQPLGLDPKHYGPHAETGRGLQLLAALAEEWGVEPTVEGKTVWFTLRLAPAARAREPAPAKAELAGMPHASMSTSDGGGHARRDAAEDSLGATPSGRPRRAWHDAPGIEIVVPAIAVQAYKSMSEHRDALMREIALVQSGRPGPGVAPSATADRMLASDVLDLWRGMRAKLGAAGRRVVVDLDRARRAGDATFDLWIGASRETFRMMVELCSALDRLDALCDAGEFLTLGSAPEVRALRRSIVSQIRRRLPDLCPPGRSGASESVGPVS